MVPTYTILAPAHFRPISEYHVSISVHGITEHVDVQISLSGPDKVSGNFNSASKSLIVNPGETRILNFEIGEWGPGNYKLIVDGKGGLNFHNETKIKYEAKSYSVFIQTDKAIYKPGQLVQFRAVVVNPSLVPAVTGAIDIFIHVSLKYPLNYLFCLISKTIRMLKATLLNSGKECSRVEVS